MPRRFTTSWSLFPPRTKEIQCDEKWGFVRKKEKNCAPNDLQQGDNWDHVALDSESRLVLSVVPGKRTIENTQALLEDVKARVAPENPRLITTDEYRAYPAVILEVFGQEVAPPRTGKQGRPRAPYKVLPAGLSYATVHKTRKQGRVVKVEPRVIFGAETQVAETLADSTASRAVNTAFVERNNATDRHRNSRKTRRTYCFSKDWEMHRAVTYFTMYSYNFCWPVRTLRRKDANGLWQKRTPAMAAGLANHVWTLREWLSLPVVQP